MPLEIRPLKPSPNDVFMDNMRVDMSTDYQARIPSATQAGIRETAKAITAHRPAYNEFVDALVNRIGSVHVRNSSWSNPLAEFKRGMLEFGDTIEEIQVGLIEGHAYDGDREYLEKDIFGTHRADVQANFHKINRRKFYPITVSEQQLHPAFLNTNGLSEFVSKLLQAPSTSDNWDEFLAMTALFPQYENNGGYWHVNVPDVRSIASGGDEARTVLRKMRAMAQTLTFMSTKYNAAGMPVAVNKEDLVIFGTPEFFAAIDVEALAGAFNMDRMTLAGRMIAVPQEQFGMEGAQAILTTTDFFVVADSRLENTNAENPVSLHRNYFLHHWQVISQSRFVPAVLFHTGADDEQIIVRTPVEAVSAVTFVNRDNETITEATRGEIYVAQAEATGTGEGVNPTVFWTVTGMNDPRTRITQNGTLHVGGRETATSLTVTATSAWINPENPSDNSAETSSATITVTGEMFPEWPAEHDHDDPETTGWVATTKFVKDDEITLTGGTVVKVQKGGTSGDVEPVAPVEGETVTDGTVVWTLA